MLEVREGTENDFAEGIGNRRGGSLKGRNMLAAGVACFLRFSTLSSPISVSLCHVFPRNRKWEDGKQRAGSGHGISGHGFCPSGSWSGDALSWKVRSLATDNMKTASQIRLVRPSLGRFLHTANGDEVSNSTPLSPSTFTKKSVRRGGIHSKLDTSRGWGAERKVFSSGWRKFSGLAKRPARCFPRLGNGRLPEEIAWSAAAFANSAMALDLTVLRTSVGSAVNLVSLCSLIVLMQKTGKLPADTPVTLSQVSFVLLIPGFLVSKVATTLQKSATFSLAALPLMAIIQVTIGASLGRLACHLFIRVPSLERAVDSSAEFNEHRRRLMRAVTKKRALITTACAFGNSLTLPLVFLSGALARAEDMNRAVGYLALYMCGWSPAMWTIGYRILTSGGNAQEPVSTERQPIWRSVAKRIGSVMNPPIYGVLVGILIGGTPILSHLFLGANGDTALANTLAPSDTGGPLYRQIRAATAGLLSPLYEAASLLGTACLAVQTVVLATSLGAAMPKAGDISRLASPEETDSKPAQVSGDVENSVSEAEASLDSTAFWVISLIRLVFLPMAGLFLTSVLKQCQLLPEDPICRFVLLVVYAMPTAQNLVLMVQLYPSTRSMAGMLAKFLFGQYALSIISLTVWTSIFLKVVPVI